MPGIVHTAFDALGTTSGGFLTSESPIQSTSQLPTFILALISPVQLHYGHLVNVVPTTEAEQHLQEALCELNTHNALDWSWSSSVWVWALFS